MNINAVLIDRHKNTHTQLLVRTVGVNLFKISAKSHRFILIRQCVTNDYY